jgi:hypothetical protein
MHETDTEYFIRRANEERAAAGTAAIEAARKAHLELANRYIDLAKALADHTVRETADGPSFSSLAQVSQNTL